MRPHDEVYFFAISRDRNQLQIKTGPCNQSALELNRQLGTHSKMALPPRQLPSGLVTKIIRPALESAGPADAASIFIILVTSTEILCYFVYAPPAGGLARGRSVQPACVADKLAA